MRYDNIIRFFGVAFVLGALVGLASGLVFGGADTGAAEQPVDQQEATDEEASADPITAEQAATIGANELGQIPVLEYHKIGDEEAEWTRTPENFQRDIEDLKAAGFYPVTVRELASGALDVPAGKTPVVLTFDDSSPGQFRLLEDGTVDPASAVGMLNAAAESEDWARKASFFVLQDVQPDDNVLFGQPEYREEKVSRLVDWGYEVGSHTITHLNLKEAAVEESTKQLALSKTEIERMAGGEYEVVSLSIPFGEYPEDLALLSGQHEDISYSYGAALEVTGGPAPSPFSSDFDPLRIPRIIARGDAVQAMIADFEDRPELRYVSDGDPAVVSVPESVAGELGQPLSDLGRPLLRY